MKPFSETFRENVNGIIVDVIMTKNILTKVVVLICCLLTRLIIIIELEFINTTRVKENNFFSALLEVWSNSIVLTKEECSGFTIVHLLISCCFLLFYSRMFL